MKLMLNVKSGNNITNPRKGDVIFYNGSDWYVTTKEELLKEACAEYKELLQNSASNLEQTIKRIADDEEVNAIKFRNLKNDYDQFKKEVAKQLYELAELNKKLYTKE